jgi:hypothetical protein
MPGATRDTATAIAFNQGSDARLRGQPMTANPFSSGYPEWRYWLMGWQDVDEHWGNDTNRTIQRLPLVQGKRA